MSPVLIYAPTNFTSVGFWHVLQEVGQTVQLPCNPCIFPYPIHTNNKFMSSHLKMNIMCAILHQLKKASNTNYSVYVIHLLGYTTTIYLVHRFCKLAWFLYWSKDQQKSVIVNGAETSAPTRYSSDGNKLLTCFNILRSNHKHDISDINFGIAGQMVQPSKFDVPAVALEVRFGFLQGSASPRSNADASGAPQAANTNQNINASVNTIDSGLGNSSDTLNQSVVHPDQTLGHVSSPAAAHNPGLNSLSTISYSTNASPVSVSSPDQSLVSESSLSGDEIGQLHYEAERLENSIINEFLDPHPSSPVSLTHDQTGQFDPPETDYQEGSWLWDMVNDAQFDQLMSDYEGHSFLRENMGGREEDLNNFIQELELQLDNQGNPDDIFDPAVSASSDNQGSVVTYSPLASSNLDSRQSQNSDVPLVPGSEPDYQLTQSSISTVSSISSRERDFRNFGDRFDAEHIHEFGVYPDAYIDYSFSTASQVSSPEVQSPLDESFPSPTLRGEVEEARLVIQHNMAQLHRCQDTETEQIVPDHTESAAMDYVDNLDTMLRAEPPLQTSDRSLTFQEESEEDIFLQRPHSWETNPENEVDRMAIALNLEYLDYELFTEDSVLSLDVLHTRADIANDRLIQEHEHEVEAGGQISDNPDLLVSDIDANAIIADGIWETYLLEQEYRTNPEGFPVLIGNQYGNYISIEEDFGVDIDEIHSTAQAQDLAFIRSYELSHDWIHPFQPP